MVLQVNSFLGFDRVHGSIYTLAPANEGIFVSEINQLRASATTSTTAIFAAFNVGCPGIAFANPGGMCVGDGTSNLSNSNGSLVGHDYVSVVNTVTNVGIVSAGRQCGWRASGPNVGFLNLTKPSSIGTEFVTLGTTGTNAAAASIILGGSPTIGLSGDNGTFECRADTVTMQLMRCGPLRLLSDGCLETCPRMNHYINRIGLRRRRWRRYQRKLAPSALSLRGPAQPPWAIRILMMESPRLAY